MNLPQNHTTITSKMRVFRLVCYNAAMADFQEEHFIGKVAQKAIIVKDGRVLITRDPHDDAVWELPGGRLNVDEKPQDGLVREINEELGVEILVEQVVYVERFVHERLQEPHLMITYVASLTDLQKPFTPSPDEVAEIKWVSKEELSAYKIFGNCERALRHYFDRNETHA